ncbi:MAG TPA: serine hydrolase domain-containing protein [Vicinamibacterales bacterium]
MAKKWNKTEVLVGLVVLGIGAVILGVAGLWIYVSATAIPLHPTAQDVRSESQAAPGENWAEAAERARQIVRAGVSEQNLPGVSVAVGIGDEIVWAEGFGFADIGQKSPVTPATKFRIGTLSIPLTAAGAGLLIEKQLLNLDEKIQAYVPEFQEQRWPVTVRQLMAHTAGIGNDSGDEGPLFGQHCDRPVEALPFIDGRELRFEPGTQYSYSRFSYILISAAIESAGDDPFLAFMQKHVFDPLGMNDTLPDSITDAIPNRATSYFPRFAADPKYGPDVMRELDLSCYAGSSIFLSTASDLARFAMALNNGRLLKPATVKLLQDPQRLTTGAETGYGLGWDLENVTLNGQPVTIVGHDGDALGGILGSLMVFRDRDMVVALISNTSYADTPSLALKVAEIFAPQDATQR